MKKLSYFLWLCVVVFWGYIVYFFLLTTNLQTRHLQGVQQQNKTLENHIVALKKEIARQTIYAENQLERFGNTKRGIYYFEQAKRLQSMGNTYLNKLQTKHDAKDIAESYKAYSILASSLDTCFQDFNNSIALYEPQSIQHHVFKQNYLFATSNKLVKLMWQGGERLFCRINGCGGFEQIHASPILAYRIVKEGTEHDCYLVLAASHSQIMPTIKITNRNVKISGNKGEITVPYQPVQFDANGRNQQQLNGQVTFRKSYQDIKDTTIYLSTSYTILERH